MAVGIPENGYFYDKQIKSLIIQFMAVFTGLQVKVGARKTGAVDTTEDCAGNVTDVQPVIEPPRLISVPIRYSSSDRVVASLLGTNTQNKPLRLPTMSAYMTGIEMAMDLYKGIGTQRRNVYTPVGGVIPDDTRVVYQRMPVPYRLNLDLNIYASNTEQHLQILEQILVLFDPTVQLETDDALFDMAKLTKLTLKGIQLSENYPVGVDRRIIQSTLNFEIIAYLMIPAQIKKNFVEQVKVRLAMVSNVEGTDQEIIAQLDALGIDYETWQDVNDLNFQ